MTVLKRINPVLTIALLFSVLLGGFVLAQGGAPKQVVVHLTHYSDNLHAVKMAVHLASLVDTNLTLTRCLRERAWESPVDRLDVDIYTNIMFPCGLRRSRDRHPIT